MNEMEDDTLHCDCHLEVDENVNPFQSKRTLPNSPLPHCENNQSFVFRSSEENINSLQSFSSCKTYCSAEVLNCEEINQNLRMASSDFQVMSGEKYKPPDLTHCLTSSTNYKRKIEGEEEGMGTALSSLNSSQLLSFNSDCVAGLKSMETSCETVSSLPDRGEPDLLCHIPCWKDRSNRRTDCSGGSALTHSSIADYNVSASGDKVFQNKTTLPVHLEGKITESFHSVVKDIFDLSTRSIEGSLPNQSEAGPDVAQFTEDDFQSVAEYFKDPAVSKFLQKAGTSEALQASALGRLSLYMKFDPLLTGCSSAWKSLKNSDETENPERQMDNMIKVQNQECSSQDTSSLRQNVLPVDVCKLIDFSSPSKNQMSKYEGGGGMFSGYSQPKQIITEEEVNGALKIQELLYHEKFMKKDQEWKKHFKSLEKENNCLEKQLIAVRDVLNINKIIASELIVLTTTFLKQKEDEHHQLNETSKKCIKERDQALEDLQGVEKAFSDLHKRYEKTKSLVEGYKQNEEWLKQQLNETQLKFQKQEQMFELLRTRTEEKLGSANFEIENAKKASEAEIAALKAQLKKAEMKTTSLERNLEEKMKENAELSHMCDDLIAKDYSSTGFLNA
ncbi:transforming acidic coiled-coil-containing protein 3-like isoform X2 [Tachypleus tridentatus]|uniref:transforming acidic coiled-coil-containing protein 3-like isoform X2 n=1 Tax=Tachypleus tridentatus TaxID=6853 RepID=UPI003FCFB2E5